MSWFSSRDAGRSGDPRNVRPSTPNWVVDRAERAQNAGKWVSALYVNDADKITGLLDTIVEALDHEAQNSHTATSQLEGSVEALEAIIDFLMAHAPECDLELINGVTKCMKDCLSNQVSDVSVLRRMKKRIKQIRTLFLNQVNLRWRALFLPYKASMWTSLESIWKAAHADSRCDTVVMPIPYFELDDRLRPASIRYEGSDFPREVPIVPFSSFSEAQEYEMIFFHNPYDDLNTITRVPEVFFSRNLTKRTKCLVYSPYFTFGRYFPGKGDHLFNAQGLVHADIILVQSERVKKIFQRFGHPSRKLLVVGSPKTDAIVAMLDGGYEVPNAWKEKVRGRKVFLLNTHLYYFHKTGARGMREHTEIVETFLERDDCSLIWRPHPLLHTLLSKTSHEFTVFYRNMCKLLASSGNCLVDTTTDYRLAFSCSNAMISTYSSLVNEYMVTGKPVLIFQRKPDSTTAQHFPLDYSGNYYRYGDQPLTYKEFIDMVVLGKDPLKDRRMKGYVGLTDKWTAGRGLPQ